MSENRENQKKNATVASADESAANETVTLQDESAMEVENDNLLRTAKARNERAAHNDQIMAPRALAETVIRLLDGKRARGLKLLHVEEKTTLADYFVICNGTSNTQLRALSAEVEEKLMEQGIEPLHIEGYNEATWILMDYGSVLVHIFNPETRNFYNLEKLWNDATEIDISSLLTED